MSAIETALDTEYSSPMLSIAFKTSGISVSSIVIEFSNTRANPNEAKLLMYQLRSGPYFCTSSSKNHIDDPDPPPV